MAPIVKGGSGNMKMDHIYKSILSRAPSSREKSMISKELDIAQLDGCKDLIWALLNSHEFMFIL